MCEAQTASARLHRFCQARSVYQVPGGIADLVCWQTRGHEAFQPRFRPNKINLFVGAWLNSNYEYPPRGMGNVAYGQKDLFREYRARQGIGLARLEQR